MVRYSVTGTRRVTKALIQTEVTREFSKDLSQGVQVPGVNVHGLLETQLSLVPAGGVQKEKINFPRKKETFSHCPFRSSPLAEKPKFQRIKTLST